MPDDLEGVVLARLNMLSPRDRLILGMPVLLDVSSGSALWLIERRHVAIPQEIGSTGRDNLTWEINRALERLEAMRFVTRVESKILGEETWAFRSKLHHDVAATIIPDATATRYNVTIEQWLRMHGDEGSLFILEELARHAEASGQNDKAALYCQRAAEVAKSQHQSTKQLRLLTGDALISDDDAPRFSISLEFGGSTSRCWSSSRALESFQEALHLAWRMRHRRHGAEALKALGQVETSRGTYAKAAKLFEAALGSLKTAKIRWVWRAFACFSVKCCGFEATMMQVSSRIPSPNAYSPRLVTERLQMLPMRSHPKV